MKYYTNRQISEKFNINLARWKRWSREFLPPDPLGGMQSGYARQYHPDQAFKVFLGGHLVGELKFTIPEARQVMLDLNDWMKNRGFFFNINGIQHPKTQKNHRIREWQIFISQDSNGLFAYQIRGLIDKEITDNNDNSLVNETYIETIIGSWPNTDLMENVTRIKLLPLSALLHRFIGILEIAPEHYETLV